MMNENESRQALKNLAIKYLKKDSELADLIKIIDDTRRPGLPVRGVLESIRLTGHCDFSDDDKLVMEELIYLYG